MSCPSGRFVCHFQVQFKWWQVSIWLAAARMDLMPTSDFCNGFVKFACPCNMEWLPQTSHLPASCKLQRLPGGQQGNCNLVLPVSAPPHTRSDTWEGTKLNKEMVGSNQLDAGLNRTLLDKRLLSGRLHVALRGTKKRISWNTLGHK